MKFELKKELNGRNWNLINCLCYLYNAFAVYTDGDLDEAEKREIIKALNEWFKDSSMNEIYAALDLTLGWFNVDLKKDLAEEGSQVVINTCVDLASHMKEQLSPEACKAIHNDLISIGMADGHYDEVEQEWAATLERALGVEEVSEFNKEHGDSLEQIAPILDVPEEIRKYAKLLDDGLITQKDYDAKKKELLGI